MAHPKITPALDRKAVTAGLTAALLLVPFASAAGASVAYQADLDEATDPLVQTIVDPELDEATDEATDTVAEIVADVVEAAVDADPEPIVSPSPSPDASPPPAVVDDGSDDDSVGSAGGTVTPMEPTQQTTTTAPTSDGGAAALAAEQTAAERAGTSGSPAMSGTRSSLRSESTLTLQPLAPLVSAPFSFATTPAPQAANGSATATFLRSMNTLEASMTAGVPAAPAGVPGTLVATATGMLLLLGGAHVLHRRGALESLRRA